MFTSRNSVENAPGKINVYSKSYTTSLKHDDDFTILLYLHSQKKLTYKIIQPSLVSSC